MSKTQNKGPTRHNVRISNISNNTIVRALAIGVVFFLALRGIYAVRVALVLIGIAFFLALALNPPVSWLAGRMTKGSRGLATGVAYFVVIGFISLLLYFVIPPMVNQTENFINNAPDIIANIKESDAALADFANKYNIPEQLEQIYNSVRDNLASAGGPIYRVLKAVVSSVGATITVLVLTFFMLVEGPRWINLLLELQPPHKRKHREDLVKKMYRVVTGYVNGQIIIALLGATSSYIIMRILGIPYALPLAGIAFLCGLIPLIGATLAGAIISVVALLKSVPTFIILVIYLLVYQQLENAFVQPKVQSKATHISPLTVLCAALIGGALAGLLGALVAIPIAACIRILVQDYIERHNLREPAKAK